MNQGERISRVQEFLKPGQGALFTEYRHRVLFLKFPSSAGTIFLTGKNRYFLVDFRYIEMAGKIQDGFQVILQEDLSAQLRRLAEENGVTEVFADGEILSLEGFESVKSLLPQGIVKTSLELSRLTRSLEEKKTEEEEACVEKAREIAARVEKRFARFVREGASLEALKRKLGELRGEEGDESRTFAGEFSVEYGRERREGVLTAGSRLRVRFETMAGLVAQEHTMEFPVEGLLPVPGESRRKALRELLWEERVGVLLCGRPNIRYYMGEDPGPEAWLFLGRDQALLLGRREKKIPGIDFLPLDRWEACLESAVRAEGIRSIYVERGVPLKTLDLWSRLPCRIIPSEELEERIFRRRSVKGEEELDRIRAAQDITDRVFLESLNYIHEGMSDVQIQRMVGLLFYDMGSQMDSFNHVCGCGQDTSLPHVKPSGRIARQGDFVMLDIGASVDGCGSDMTRMVGIGEVDPEKREIYRLVLQAQNAALRQVRAGAVCCEIDAAARTVISGQGYGNFFLHGLGHPVGSGGREGPRFSQSDKSVLRPGVVMTVEPGVYLPGKFGVRIEDMVYVPPQGAENLTHSPKELICVR